MFDAVIVVLRDKNSRIESIIKRDGLTRQEIENRILKQFDYVNTNFEKYYVIHNNGNFDKLRDITADTLLKITQKYNQ